MHAKYIISIRVYFSNEDIGKLILASCMPSKPALMSSGNISAGIEALSPVKNIVSGDMLCEVHTST